MVVGRSRIVNIRSPSMFLIRSFVRSEKYYTAQSIRSTFTGKFICEGKLVTSHTYVLSTRHKILPNVTSQKNVCVGDYGAGEGEREKEKETFVVMSVRPPQNVT